MAFALAAIRHGELTMETASMCEITRTPLTRDELECAVDLTERLVRLRQNECKHLCIENIGPEIFKRVMAAYFPPVITMDAGPLNLGEIGFPFSA